MTTLHKLPNPVHDGPFISYMMERFPDTEFEVDRETNRLTYWSPDHPADRTSTTLYNFSRDFNTWITTGSPRYPSGTPITAR